MSKLVYNDTAVQKSPPQKRFFCVGLEEVPWHVVPPHNRAAGVQSKQAQKKNVFTFFGVVWWKNGPPKSSADGKFICKSQASNSEEVSWHVVPPHNRAAGVQSQNRHKKKNVFTFFLAPVEGLGPPTLRLTAECSTDWAKQAFVSWCLFIIIFITLFVKNF